MSTLHQKRDNLFQPENRMGKREYRMRVMAVRRAARRLGINQSEVARVRKVSRNLVCSFLLLHTKSTPTLLFYEDLIRRLDAAAAEGNGEGGDG